MLDENILKNINRFCGTSSNKVNIDYRLFG
jgi:hypothetical protein